MISPNWSLVTPDRQCEEDHARGVPDTAPTPRQGRSRVPVPERPCWWPRSLDNVELGERVLRIPDDDLLIAG